MGAMLQSRALMETWRSTHQLRVSLSSRNAGLHDTPVVDVYFWALPTQTVAGFKTRRTEGHPSTAPPNVRGRVLLMVQDVSLTMGD